jgi:1,4-alpha-glucan branching enzyme
VTSADRRSASEDGALAIVLHTHMPYVEGFGTWPFGEEWLWEAMAGCYLPLLDLLDSGAPLTLSLTPVLCDQLEAPGIAERFGAFVGEVRRYTHDEDAQGLRAGGHEGLAREVERSWGDYERALERLDRCGGNLLGALAPYAQWTSSATHAVLPLLATDAGVRAQIQTGVQAHRVRFTGAGWRGGFWLPECAYAPWLTPVLADAGVHATCVELTDRLGLGACEHLRPLVGEEGVMLVPIDRATMALVWSDDGYPAAGVYRDYHHHTVHHHTPWGNDGEPYDHERALALAREHAADFVARTRERLDRDGAGLPGGGLAVCALDTELLGHWWYEGIAWLEAVVEECARQGLELVRLDDALERLEPASLQNAGMEHEDGGEVSSWGKDGDLSTWSGPQVAELAFATRAAELEVVAAGPAAGTAAVRELLALQASDWPFMLSRGLAVPYARERFEGHRRALARALAEGSGASAEGLRNLAVHTDAAALLAP